MKRAALVLCMMLAAAGCRRPSGISPVDSPDPTAPPGSSTPSGGHASTLPAGTTCTGRDDCPAEQVCMASVCRPRRSSPSGEILAAAAQAQLDAGDLQSAVDAFDKAIDAYQHADAPVPPSILCRAASTALRSARAPEQREDAARRADLCFRGSMPGEPSRAEVASALARLRYDGLDPSRFDRGEPSSHYFGLEPTRPTVDAIDIAIDLPDRDDAGYTELRDMLRGQTATRAISDCFVQDWEVRHDRQASAALTLKLTSRLRDMGDYDTYDTVIEVTQTTAAEDGFEPCLARALGAALTPGPRLSRVVAWQAPFEVAAHLQ